VHELVAPREYLPLAQAAHELLELSAKVPAPQYVQTDCPSLSLTKPAVALQEVQVDAAMLLYVPTGQSEQVSADLMLYVPGAHRVHAASLDAEKRPGWQSSQSEASEPLYFPASQIEQTEDVAREALPAEHV
jgi:hypothetical protein